MFSLLRRTSCNKVEDPGRGEGCRGEGRGTGERGGCRGEGGVQGRGTERHDSHPILFV